MRPSPPHRAPQTESRLPKFELTVPILLVLLSVVPMIGGIVRMVSLSSGAMKPQDVRFVSAPLPIVIHVLTSVTYSVVGAFQFSRGIRRRWPVWHRRVGRILAMCGLAVGVTGLWMTARYDIPGDLQGPLVYYVRLVVGSAMVTCLVLGIIQILRRKVAQHEAFMIRAYALGQGAGTQALLMLPLVPISGELLGAKRDIVMTAAWLINTAIAEWIIRRRSSQETARDLPTRAISAS